MASRRDIFIVVLSSTLVATLFFTFMTLFVRQCKDRRARRKQNPSPSILHPDLDSRLPSPSPAIMPLTKSATFTSTTSTFSTSPSSRCSFNRSRSSSTLVNSSPESTCQPSASFYTQSAHTLLSPPPAVPPLRRASSFLTRLFCQSPSSPSTTKRHSFSSSSSMGKGVLPFHNSKQSPCHTNAPSITSSQQHQQHPLNTAEIAAPACFPGGGPNDMALRPQQLLQLQTSCRRASATPPVIQRGSRHLIPHHHHLNQQPPLHPHHPVSSDAHGLLSPLTPTTADHLSWANMACPPDRSTTTSPVFESRRADVLSRAIRPLELALSSSEESISARQSMDDMEVLAENSTRQIEIPHTSFSLSSTTIDSGETFWKGDSQDRKSSLGHGYDITTMFQVRPLPSSTLAT